MNKMFWRRYPLPKDDGSFSCSYMELQDVELDLPLLWPMVP